MHRPAGPATHHCLNVTWRCQNQCSYCWVSHSVRQRPEQCHAKERPLADWVAAIKRDRVGVAEVVGGEPLLVEWVPELIASCSDTLFGLTTNGLAIEAMQRLCEVRLPNLIGVTVSLHPDTPTILADGDTRYLTRFLDAIQLAQSRYTVGVNLVDHGKNLARCKQIVDSLQSVGIHVVIVPYESVADLKEFRYPPLTCRAGESHLLVCPDGAAYTCLTALRSPHYGRYHLGNWLDGRVNGAGKPVPCYLKCSHYDVPNDRDATGDMWGVRARPWHPGNG